MSRKLLNEELNRLTTEEYKDAEKLPIVVVLDNVRSLNNIGSVFRTSDAFRLSKIYLCGITATPPHREIHKTALGAEESVDWEYFEETTDAVQALKNEGIHDSIRGTSGKQYFSGTIRHRKRTKICFHLRKRGKRRATGSS